MTHSNTVVSGNVAVAASLALYLNKQNESTTGGVVRLLCWVLTGLWEEVGVRTGVGAE